MRTGDRKRVYVQALFASDDHAAVEATWGIYPNTAADYRHQHCRQGRTLMTTVITDISTGAAKALT